MGGHARVTRIGADVVNSIDSQLGICERRSWIVRRVAVVRRPRRSSPRVAVMRRPPRLRGQSPRKPRRRLPTPSSKSQARNEPRRTPPCPVARGGLLARIRRRDRLAQHTAAHSGGPARKGRAGRLLDVTCIHGARRGHVAPVRTHLRRAPRPVGNGTGARVEYRSEPLLRVVSASDRSSGRKTQRPQSLRTRCFPRPRSGGFESRSHRLHAAIQRLLLDHSSGDQ
jgi:hypothetical protein